VNLCVVNESAEHYPCGSLFWLCLNDALYSATHPSYMSNVGPTAIIFTRYVDVVRVGQWVVFLETDGRIPVVVCKGQQDLLSLIISYTGIGYKSVNDIMLCTIRQ
jgi:hypothetical protein